MGIYENMWSNSETLPHHVTSTWYHDFLPPLSRGSHVKSDYTHTIIHHTPLSPYTKHLCPDFLYLRPFNKLLLPHLTPVQVIIHQSAVGRSERRKRQARVAAWNSIIYVFTQSIWTKLSRCNTNSNKNWVFFQRPATSHGLKSVKKHRQIRR